jgi:cyclopropane-fatty-acyl-phospholipid synthase
MSLRNRFLARLRDRVADARLPLRVTCWDGKSSTSLASRGSRSRAQGPPGGEFIDRLVFPGGEVPHISRVLYEVAGIGLELLDIEDLRPHYPPTLLH